MLTKKNRMPRESFESAVDRVYNLTKDSVCQVFKRFPNERLTYKEVFAKAYTHCDSPLLPDSESSNVLSAVYSKIVSEYNAALILGDNGEAGFETETKTIKDGRLNWLEARNEKYEDESYLLGISVERIVAIDTEYYLETLVNYLQEQKKSESTSNDDADSNSKTENTDSEN